MADIAVHAVTARQLELFKANPTHAVVFVGTLGIGKSTVAKKLISEVLNIKAEKLETYSYLRFIEPDGSSISIEAIRELSNFLKLKTIGKEPLRRFVVIEHAGSLTLEAQNALLKSLEEPPADTIMILTLENERDVLPTILSRLRTIRVQMPTKDQLKRSFSQLDNEAFHKAYNLSSGLPGLMHALAQNADHPLIEAVNQAKQTLRATSFERLQLVDGLSKQKTELMNFLQALKLISDTSLTQVASRQDDKNIRRWQQIMTATTKAETAMLDGAQPKLALTNLMLEL